MSDFFSRLAARSLDSPPAALPRIASRFVAPNWDRSPQTDTQLDASGSSDQLQPEAAANAARSHRDGEGSNALTLRSEVRRDRPTSDEHSFAVDPENSTRTTGHARALERVPSNAHAELNGIASKREAGVIGSERSDQLGRASLANIPATDSFDPLSQMRGRVASARQASAAPASTSRPSEAAANMSGDIARVTPPSSNDATARLFRASDVREHERSRATPPDVARTTPDAPPAPEIYVSIGRIEVRAVVAPVTATPRPRPAPIAPTLSLDAYLRKREEGSG